MSDKKRWTEMTADEQVPPWSWLMEEQLLWDELNAHNKAAESDGTAGPTKDAL